MRCHWPPLPPAPLCPCRTGERCRAVPSFSPVFVMAALPFPIMHTLWREHASLCMQACVSLPGLSSKRPVSIGILKNLPLSGASATGGHSKSRLAFHACLLLATVQGAGAARFSSSRPRLGLGRCFALMLLSLISVFCIYTKHLPHLAIFALCLWLWFIPFFPLYVHLSSRQSLKASPLGRQKLCFARCLHMLMVSVEDDFGILRTVPFKRIQAWGSSPVGAGALCRVRLLLNGPAHQERASQQLFDTLQRRTKLPRQDNSINRQHGGKFLVRCFSCVNFGANDK